VLLQLEAAGHLTAAETYQYAKIVTTVWVKDSRSGQIKKCSLSSANASVTEYAVSAFACGRRWKPLTEACGRAGGPHVGHRDTVSTKCGKTCYYICRPFCAYKAALPAHVLILRIHKQLEHSRHTTRSLRNSLQLLHSLRWHISKPAWRSPQRTSLFGRLSCNGGDNEPI
jgi:hypothetical protein